MFKKAMQRYSPIGVRKQLRNRVGGQFYGMHTDGSMSLMLCAHMF